MKQIQGKLMTNFFFKFKKPNIWSNISAFPQFFEQKMFFQKSNSVMHNLKGFLAPCQNSEKSNDPIPRKHPDRLQDGWTDPIP